jgi:Na+/H+-dicarboxylate symporter
MALHWKILIGMALGVLVGVIAAATGSKEFVVDWRKPFGPIVINLRKLIAMPLIIASLRT